MQLPSFIRLLPLTALISVYGGAQSLTMVEQKALDIRTHLDKQLYTMPLEQQGDYALMLYRTTGNKTYLDTARVSLYLSADRLQKLEGSIRTKASRRELLLHETMTIKSEFLDEYSDHFFFAFFVLPELNRIDQFAMTLKGGIGEAIDRSVSGFDFKKGLTAPDLLKDYAPQLAEQVYLLLSLGYGDYRQPFINAFQGLYPNSRDKELSVEQRLIKWLTMTHLVLAASDQLQEPVNDPLLKWIPDYFRENEDQILREGDDVLQAKTGLTLLLTGNNDAGLLKKIRERLSQRPVSDTIEKADFWSMLLLGWVKDYYPDPALYQMLRFRNKTPYILKPAD